VIVVDASAVVDALIDHSEVGDRARRRIHGPGHSLHAPHLLDLEVTNAVRRLVAAGSLSQAAATGTLADLVLLRVSLYPHRPQLARIWALRRNLTPYDAAYLALAEVLRVPLLTTDRRLAREARKHVEVLA